MSTIQDLTDLVTNQLLPQVAAVDGAVTDLVNKLNTTVLDPADQAEVDTLVANVQTASNTLSADVAKDQAPVNPAPPADAEAPATAS